MNNRLAILVVFLYTCEWLVSTIIIARSGKAISYAQIAQIQLLVLLSLAIWRVWRWYFYSNKINLSWLIYTLPLVALEVLETVGRRVGSGMPTDEYIMTTSQFQAYIPLAVLLLGHMTRERGLRSMSDGRLGRAVDKVALFQSVCVVTQTICITWLLDTLYPLSQRPELILSICANLGRSLRLAYMGALLSRQTVTPSQLLCIAAVYTAGMGGLPGLDASFDLQIFQPVATTCLGLLILLHRWLLPTLMVLALGSLAAARTEGLIGHTLVYINHDEMFGAHSIGGTACGITLCAVVACLVSQFYGSWHQHRRANREQARGVSPQTNTGDSESHFVLLQP